MIVVNGINGREAGNYFQNAMVLIGKVHLCKCLRDQNVQRKLPVVFVVEDNPFRNAY